jgi:type II secretory pathway component PulM
MSEPTSSVSRLKGALEGILRSPLRLRVVVGVTLLGAWYVALYQPAIARITTVTRRLGAERRRLELAVQIEDLRLLTRRFQGRLPRSPDQNEVVQYLVGGIRQRPIKLVSLVPRDTSELGPFKLVQVVVSVEGSYASLEALVRWIETDPHLFRIEQIDIQRARAQARPGQAGVYVLELTVVGIYG